VLDVLSSAELLEHRREERLRDLDDGDPDPRLRPGMNGGMDIIVNRIPNAISIPAKALFTHAGKPIVYVANSGRYKPIAVEVLARNPDEVAVTGIQPGAMVTLVDPERKDAKK